MATVVITRTTCDRCGKVDERNGAEGEVPPVDWAICDLQYRAPGAGWSGGGRRIYRWLCPSCAVLVKDILERC